MVKELFDYCRQLETEYNNSLLYNASISQWDGKRLAMYVQGPFHGMYRENNQVLRKYLEQDVNREKLLNLLKKYARDSFNEEETQLKMLNESNILEWMNGYNAIILEDLKGEPESVQLRFLELYIEYSYYKKNIDRIAAQAEIDRIYADDANYSSNYKLISVTDSRELLVLNKPRIYDPIRNKTIFLFTPKSVVAVIKELNDSKCIGTCSFRGSGIADGKILREILQEEIEYGKLFPLSLEEELPRITKMYSKSYENQLWIKHEKKELALTFEELLKGTDYGDDIRTQMIHLLYVKNGDCYYISHLDHEYIFYTREEYEIRKQSMDQKGNAKKREKTFKIDDSKIPFDYQCKVFRRGESGSLEEFSAPFIYFMVNAYFEHKDLLEEYFVNILRMDVNS